VRGSITNPVHQPAIVAEVGDQFAPLTELPAP
jgi:hypothetical protein